MKYIIASDDYLFCNRLTSRFTETLICSTTARPLCATVRDKEATSETSDFAPLTKNPEDSRYEIDKEASQCEPAKSQRLWYKVLGVDWCEDWCTSTKAQYEQQAKTSKLNKQRCISLKILASIYLLESFT